MGDADPIARSFIMIGALLMLALGIDSLHRRLPIPRVTLFILLGVIAGPAVLDAIPPEREALFPAITDVALVMIALLVGGEFDRNALRRRGRSVVTVATVQAAATFIAVAGVFVAFGVDPVIALLLGAIATATDPAATVAVAHESQARGPLTRTLFGVVAVDDVLGLMTFSVVVASAEAFSEESVAAPLLEGAWEIAGAVGFGLLLGVPAALLSGRIRSGEPTLWEAMAIVFLVAGLADWLQFSEILAAVVLGATVVNLAGHHTRTFREIEHIEWLFLVLFFFLAGAALEFDALLEVGLLGAGYMVLRTAGKVAGAWAGGVFAGLPRRVSRWLGPALLPQAGVALGFALVAAEQFPDQGGDILSIALASTVVFELTGALLTRVALDRVGEVHQQ